MIASSDLAQAFAWAIMADQPLHESLGVILDDPELDELEAREIQNLVSARWYALERDCPGKVWFYADIDRRAPIYRALMIDPDEDGASYAVAPFRLARMDGEAVILAAWPCPPLFSDDDVFWLGIETVMVWNPVRKTVAVMGDVEPQIVGAFPQDGRAASLFGDPFAFFRAWAEQRAAFSVAYRTARSAHYTVAPTEVDRPGCLLIGNPAKVRWASYQIPRDLECVGLDASVVNKAILRSANLPRAFQRAA